MLKIQRLITAAAVVGLLGLSACGTYESPGTATPGSAASHADDKVEAGNEVGVEIKDAVLIAGSNGSAMLTAKIVNHTGAQLDLQEAEFNGLETMTGVHGAASIAAEGETPIGKFEEDSYRIQVLEGAKPGTDVTGTIQFGPTAGGGEELPPTTFTASIVARSAANDDLLGVPANAIEVKDAVIVVVPGQERAYIGGTVVSKINDMTTALPTATNAQGKAVEYRHQTATGGPSGISADKNSDIPLGGPPYRVSQPDEKGDADYFNAADVTVGEIITVTIPFQSGVVIVDFKVIAG